MTYLGLIAELENNTAYPSINSMLNKPLKEKDRVLDYMKKGEIIAAAPGITRDVINGDIKIPELFLMSDGEYEWRSDIIYYVDKYDLGLPESFVEHILNGKE